MENSLNIPFKIEKIYYVKLIEIVSEFSSPAHGYFLLTEYQNEIIDVTTRFLLGILPSLKYPIAPFDLFSLSYFGENHLYLFKNKLCVVKEEAINELKNCLEPLNIECKEVKTKKIPIKKVKTDTIFILPFIADVGVIVYTSAIVYAIFMLHQNGITLIGGDTRYDDYITAVSGVSNLHWYLNENEKGILTKKMIKEGFEKKYNKKCKIITDLYYFTQNLYRKELESLNQAKN